MAFSVLWWPKGLFLIKQMGASKPNALLTSEFHYSLKSKFKVEMYCPHMPGSSLAFLFFFSSQHWDLFNFLKLKPSSPLVSWTACWRTNSTCHLRKLRGGLSTLSAMPGWMQRLTPSWWDLFFNYLKKLFLNSYSSSSFRCSSTATTQTASHFLSDFAIQIRMGILVLSRHVLAYTSHQLSVISKSQPSPPEWHRII